MNSDVYLLSRYHVIVIDRLLANIGTLIAFLPTGLTEIGQFCDPTKPDSWIGQTHFQPWYQQKTLEPNDFHGTAVTAEYNLGLLSWPLVQNGPKSEPPRESSLNRIKSASEARLFHQF